MRESAAMERATSVADRPDTIGLCGFARRGPVIGMFVLSNLVRLLVKRRSNIPAN
jgi:hypothetical protein